MSFPVQSQQSQRLQTVAVERGEYWCPLCRQLANSVLPLHPEEQALALARRGCPPLRTLAHDLLTLLGQVPTPVSTFPALSTAYEPSIGCLGNLSSSCFNRKNSYSSPNTCSPPKLSTDGARPGARVSELAVIRF